MTDAHKAKARQLVADMMSGKVEKNGVTAILNVPGGDRDRFVPVLSWFIAAALRDCERETLERAAKVARDYAADRTEGWPGFDQDEICHAVCGDVALRIRALAQEEPKA